MIVGDPPQNREKYKIVKWRSGIWIDQVWDAQFEIAFVL